MSERPDGFHRSSRSCGTSAPVRRSRSGVEDNAIRPQPRHERAGLGGRREGGDPQAGLREIPKDPQFALRPEIGAVQIARGLAGNHLHARKVRHTFDPCPFQGIDNITHSEERIGAKNRCIKAWIGPPDKGLNCREGEAIDVRDRQQGKQVARPRRQRFEPWCEYAWAWINRAWNDLQNAWFGSKTHLRTYPILPISAGIDGSAARIGLQF
jgi:hypothetical protein